MATACDPMLQIVDAVETLGIDPADASPDYWHHVHIVCPSTKCRGFIASASSGLAASAEDRAVTGRLAAERGLTFTTAKAGEYVSGTLVGSTQLASGRFEMIDDGIGFQLVPWQPLPDKRIGQHITGIMRDAGSIEWGFGRKRGLGL
jgi:hypothetical protein